MKLGKITKTEKILNPFRKRKPFLRNYTLCRVTEKTMISCDPDVYTLQIDCDEVADFKTKLLTIPNPQKYYDGIYEMWFVTEKWQTKVLDWAIKFFDEVKIERLDGTVNTLKKRKI